MRRVGTAGRAVLVLLLCAAVAATTWRLSRAPLLRVTRAPLSFTDALTALCAVVLQACVLWLLTGAVLAVLASVAAGLTPGSHPAAALSSLADHGCPRGVRRLVATILGVALTAGLAGPVHASAPARGSRGPGPPGGAVPVGSVGSVGLTGLALPERTTGALRHRSAAHEHPTVVVAPGDSLWSIAASLLPPGAGDPRVTDAWHHLHRANRSRIGADPDLILPGTRLAVPRILATERKEHR